MDELSGMTYMSYFMSVGACGYQATLKWLQQTISPIPVSNFDTDWNDGLVASALVSVLGADVGWPYIDTKDNFNTCKKAIEVSSKEFRLPVEKFIIAKDMTNKEVDHIEIMAYAAWHRNGPDKRIKLHRPVGVKQKEPEIVPVPIEEPEAKPEPEPEPVVVPVPIEEPETKPEPEPEPEREPEVIPVPIMTAVPRISTNEQRLSSIEEVTSLEDQEEVDFSGRVVRFAPRPPSPPTPPEYEEEPEPEISLELFAKDIVPLHYVVSAEVHVYQNDFSAAAPISKANDLIGIFTAPSGSITEAEIFLLTNNKYNLTFQPDEPGTWFLDLLYKGEKTRDLPWRILVIDPKAAKIKRAMPEPHLPEEEYIFKIDTSELNHDAVDVSVEYLGQLIPYQVVQHISSIDTQMVKFVPKTLGIYTVSVKCLGKHISDSPFDLLVSTNEIFATGTGLREAVQGIQSTFRIDVGNLPGKQLEVKIKDPFGKDVKCITAHSDSLDGDVIEYSVFFTPLVHGKHKISVVYDHQEIIDSPFYTDVKIPRIYVKDLEPVATLGKRHRFNVDATEASDGVVMIDSDLPVVAYDKIENKKYAVEVMPRKTGRHDLKILYNNKEVEGSPFEVEVVKGETAPRHAFMKGPRIADTQLLRDAFEY